MNKMDLDMLSQAETTVEKPTGLWARMRSIAIFAAPLVVIVGGIALFALMMATAPKPEEKGGTPHPPARPLRYADRPCQPRRLS